MSYQTYFTPKFAVIKSLSSTKVYLELAEKFHDSDSCLEYANSTTLGTSLDFAEAEPLVNVVELSVQLYAVGRV